MKYSIQEAARITGLTPSTLRYYESEGLLPNIKRAENRHRYYDESNLEWIAVINCLKNTNMPIEQIKEFVILNSQGDGTLYKRLELILKHRENVQKKIDELNKYMEHINYKVDYFTMACELGTEKELKKERYPNHFYIKEDE
ncbi:MULTISPECIES: MerR family transcriptional regulator [Clostridium]|jgi:DNA-binding transcriptional MerR regulator|uniref:MerR family transcriptional regulator n=2 Tax=Clostridium beijerinckii TaxID=1520 RepID=A0AAE2RSD6_CLOBE|nr:MULTISPECIES: MerR family transcriptional regulator [Clostridium]ABR36083.1 putative transcriptional regulator, MerR family [Clostridium beijerinckii NCIMB 8052]AIU03634.1 MerR family transcriptional regulator [Clostridium beijerinckii ATCC 35702]MBF7809271.1 MerR family transcriptional regulator [Clostridium beijerinckii]NOW89797.1 DNA-binding transcriptional MerR regulator [Clostridium beijerinckii]NRT22862.1 DNA-binding transcriptional MerR regulator [Clostridium beijerinckii]